MKHSCPKCKYKMDQRIDNTFKCAKCGIVIEMCVECGKADATVKGINCGFGLIIPAHKHCVA